MGFYFILFIYLFFKTIVVVFAANGVLEVSLLILCLKADVIVKHLFKLNL